MKSRKHSGVQKARPPLYDCRFANILQTPTQKLQLIVLHPSRGTEQVIKLCRRGLFHSGHEVTVGVECERYARMTKALTHDFGMLAGLKQQARMSVSKVMEARL